MLSFAIFILEIVDRVGRNENPPFRPAHEGGSENSDTITSTLKLMQHCWQENPEDRPKFADIERILRTINKGRY